MEGRIFNEIQQIQASEYKVGSSFSSCSGYVTLDGFGIDMYSPQAILRAPTGTPYEGVCLGIKIQIPTEYPFKPPHLHFETKVWHPNVDFETGNIRILPLTETGWRPYWTLQKLLHAVLLMMREPILLDVRPANEMAANAYAADTADFFKIARFWAEANEAVADGPWECLVQKYVDMGFSRAMAREALDVCQGDEDMVLDALLTSVTEDTANLNTADASGIDERDPNAPTQNSQAAYTTDDGKETTDEPAECARHSPTTGETLFKRNGQLTNDPNQHAKGRFEAELGLNNTVNASTGKNQPNEDQRRELGVNPNNNDGLATTKWKRTEAKELCTLEKLDDMINGDDSFDGCFDGFRPLDSALVELIGMPELEHDPKAEGGKSDSNPPEVTANAVAGDRERESNARNVEDNGDWLGRLPTRSSKPTRVERRDSDVSAEDWLEGLPIVSFGHPKKTRSFSNQPEGTSCHDRCVSVGDRPAGAVPRTPTEHCSVGAVNGPDCSCPEQGGAASICIGEADSCTLKSSKVTTNADTPLAPTIVGAKKDDGDERRIGSDSSGLELDGSWSLVDDRESGGSLRSWEVL